jgi:hypothetical protein
MQWIYDIAYGVLDDPQRFQTAIIVVAGLAAAVLALGIFYIVMGASDPIRRRCSASTPFWVP